MAAPACRDLGFGWDYTSVRFRDPKTVLLHTQNLSTFIRSGLSHPTEELEKAIDFFGLDADMRAERNADSIRFRDPETVLLHADNLINFIGYGPSNPTEELEKAIDFFGFDVDVAYDWDSYDVEYINYEIIGPTYSTARPPGRHYGGLA